jgi:hypothetical protein
MGVNMYQPDDDLERKTAVEELLAENEALRVKSEELIAKNEELIAKNEELIAKNEELKAKLGTSSHHNNVTQPD